VIQMDTAGNRFLWMLPQCQSHSQRASLPVSVGRWTINCIDPQGAALTFL
jgi:hypothetical protein